MPQIVRDIMTSDPVTIAADASIVEAARLMRDEDIGDVLVLDGDELIGICTDRDLVVRGLAEGGSAEDVRVEECCSEDLVTVDADSGVEEVIELMRKHDVRRVPVVDGDECIGVVSLGDLAVIRDPESVLGDISAAPPTR